MVAALYRRQLAELDWPLLLRWLLAGTCVGLLALHAPAPQGLVELVVSASATLVVLAVVLWLLGERDLFRRAYWSRAPDAGGEVAAE